MIKAICANASDDVSAYGVWLTAAGLGLLRPGPVHGGQQERWRSGGFSQQSRLAGAIGNVLVYFLISWWLCNRLIDQLEIEDEPQIVADEVAGMWLALVWLPQSIGWCLAAFVLFRLADIYKPGPIGALTVIFTVAWELWPTTCWLAG